MNNVFDCSIDIMHTINHQIALNDRLRKTYESVGDTVNANRCWDANLVLLRLSDRIDNITLRYDISVTECLESNSFVWTLQQEIARMIDSILACGYHYVMRDSRKLKAQFRELEYIYEYVNIAAKKHDVYV